MKKGLLALLLGGGVFASGALFIPGLATVQADTVTIDCDGYSATHIKSSQVTTVDGKLAVTIEVDFETENGTFFLYAFDKPLEKEHDDSGMYPEDYYQTWGGMNAVAKIEDIKESGTYAFDGLADGKTYYVYCNIDDNHECFGWGEGGDPNDTYWHGPAAYLGSGGSGSGSSDNGSSNNGSSDNAPSGSSNETEAVSYEDELNDQIATAEPGSTIIVKKGVTTLTNYTMKELLAKGDVSLKLEFTYQDKEYVIIIPAGKAVDNDISYYGPLYLAQQYGNSAETGVSEAGGTYVVKSGDSLSKIAKANNMTLKQLLNKNPQIKDPNKIYVGQKINR